MQGQEAASGKASLEDYSRLVYLFMKANREQDAVDAAEKLVRKFDPKNEFVRIPDDEKVWQALLKQIQYKVISYADLVKDKRAKNDHALLMDYMYDTREGAANHDHPERRPDFDRFNADMDKAASQIETIRKNYPDCPTLTEIKASLNEKLIPQPAMSINEWADAFKDKYPILQEFKIKAGAGGKAMLQIVEDEIDFRKKVLAARKLISRSGLNLSEDFDKNGRLDEARRYRRIAIEQTEAIIQHEGETPLLLIQLAKSYMLQAQYDEAIKTANKAITQIDDTDPAHFNAKKLVSQVQALKKNWHEALEFPEAMARIVGFDSRLVIEQWPDMKEFMKKCYTDSASEIPSDIKKLLEDKVNK